MHPRMSELLRFLTSRKFFKHLAIIIVSFILLIASVSIYINIITKHGDKLQMPDLLNKTLDQAKESASDFNFEFVVVDSVFLPDHPKGTIVEQIPKAGTHIKKSRVVFITLNALNKEIIKMPDLINNSLRQAKSILESYGLQMGEIQYKPYFAENYVLEQRFRGRVIRVGDKIQKGSKIDLVIGIVGNDTPSIDPPNLVGLSYKDALSVISTSSLNVGARIYSETMHSAEDSMNSVIYKQDPPIGGKKLIPGSIIDLWLKKGTKSEETSDIIGEEHE